MATAFPGAATSEAVSVCQKIANNTTTAVTAQKLKTFIVVPDASPDEVSPRRLESIMEGGGVDSATRRASSILDSTTMCLSFVVKYCRCLLSSTCHHQLL